MESNEMVGGWKRPNKASSAADSTGIGNAEGSAQIILRGRESTNMYLDGGAALVSK